MTSVIMVPLYVVYGLLRRLTLGVIYVLSHRALFGLLVIILIIGALSVINGLRTGAPKAPEYQSNVPAAVAKLPVIITPNRYYYVARMAEDGDTVTLLDFYEYAGDEWQRRTQPLPLKRSEIKIPSR